jgi:hypothetical protein
LKIAAEKASVLMTILTFGVLEPGPSPEGNDLMEDHGTRIPREMEDVFQKEKFKRSNFTSRYRPWRWGKVGIVDRRSCLLSKVITKLSIRRHFFMILVVVTVFD